MLDKSTWLFVFFMMTGNHSFAQVGRFLFEAGGSANVTNLNWSIAGNMD